MSSCPWDSKSGGQDKYIGHCRAAKEIRETYSGISHRWGEWGRTRHMLHLAGLHCGVDLTQTKNEVRALEYRIAT